MGQPMRLRSAEALRSAFRVDPEVMGEPGGVYGLGVYGWRTPFVEGFEVPENDELIVALHLGGSQRVREVLSGGLSPTRSHTGRLTLMPPRRRAEFSTLGGVSFVSLHIPARAMTVDPGLDHLRLLTRPGSARFAFRDGFVRAGMQSLLGVAQSGRDVRPDYYSRMADALLFHLAHLDDGESPDPLVEVDPQRALGKTSLGELMAHIDAHLGRKLGIDELASLSGLGRTAFSRRFGSALGLSPHQYLNLRRVETAKTLMRESSLDLAGIARRTGFSSLSHFIAVFRSLTGGTPARFRAPH